jgi:hypothetical protein
MGGRVVARVGFSGHAWQSDGTVSATGGPSPEKCAFRRPAAGRMLATP